MSGRDRSTLSCARCYLMKKKCDKKVPSCTRCTRAQTPCLDINRSDGTEVPRSAVKYLESRLAEIENDPMHRPRAFPASVDQEQSQKAYNIHGWVVQVASAAITSVCTPSLLQSQAGIHYAAKLFYPSERPPLKIPVKGVYHEDPPRRASLGCIFRLPDMGALRIPFEVTRALFNNYISNILPKYPSFDETDLVDRFNHLYSTGNSPGHAVSDTTSFIVSMILAISSLTSKAHDFRKVASLSESLQRDAMRHSSLLQDTSIQSLQCFLLVIQMALLLPYTSNLWYLSGEAMRMAIALGLHQEAEMGVKLEPAQAQLRRRLFWTVYQLERTIAIASGCPLAISDDHITTQLPSLTPFEGPGIGRLHQSKWSQFLSQVQLCQIQSEIHGVQFFDQRLPKDVLDYGDWVRKMENSIQVWQQSSTSDGGLPGWSANAANHCRLLLYRPCSRNIVPPGSSLQEALTAAISMIQGYWNLVQIGNLVFSFEYVYHAFQAGMVLLYALRNHGGAIQNSSLENDGHTTLNLLIQLFDALSERWPVAADTGHYVKELKDSILRFVDSGMGTGRSAYDVNLLAELDFTVTQRRIHSLYHRNIEVPTPEERRSSSEPSLRPQSDSFAPFPDELWQEFIDTGFQYLADDSLLFLESSEGPQVTQESDRQEGIARQLEDNAEDSRSTVDVGMLIKSLPACGFCRKQHVKCDRAFPSCTACHKSDRECTYFDIVLQQDVSRSYVYALYERLTEMSSNANTGPVAHGLSLPGRSSNPGSTRFHNILLPSIPFQQRHGTEYCLNTLFFGRPSALACLEHAMSSTTKEHTAAYGGGWTPPAREGANLEYHDVQPPPISVASGLFRLFARSANIFYPTMTKFHLDNIIAKMYHSQLIATSAERDLFYLVIAIAAQVARTPVSGLPFTPQVYFLKATHHQEGLYQSGAGLGLLLLLQRTLLICIYLLLSPESGDIWRNLGFAIRLYFDISHRPSENDGMNEELLNMLSRALYCLECPISIAFGRPSLLVIGDTLREAMARPISTATEERVSIYFYRISLLKMQVHSTLLLESEHQASPMLGEDYQMYRRELDGWKKDWERELGLFQERARDDPEAAMPLLAAWANLNYHHAAFLVTYLTPAISQYPLQDCDMIARSCSYLTRHQRRSVLPTLSNLDLPLPPVFPTDWTLAHLVFSVGLSLSGRPKQYATGTCERTAAMGRCLSSLALLEGDPATLSTGFSEVLEGLFYDSPSENH